MHFKRSEFNSRGIQVTTLVFTMQRKPALTLFSAFPFPAFPFHTPHSQCLGFSFSFPLVRGVQGRPQHRGRSGLQQRPHQSSHRDRERKAQPIYKAC